MAQAESKSSTKEEPKVFHDPIHGHMEFHPYLVKIIDTPQFQRLRNIKQLGGAYFVYPGASHNRFEHSLGVAHLAGQLVRNLKEKLDECSDRAELGDITIDERDILCVEIAGLCHDLGHGPFSHMFDRMFFPKARPNIKWKHEEASVKMFEHIVNKLKVNGFDLLEELKKLNKENKGNDLEFIKEMILSPNEMRQYKGRPRNKSFLYEIVSNSRNGLDVDKFDYFARDCYHLGIKNSFDHCRFIKLARVCEVDGQLQICTRDKEQPNIYEMFHTRSRLHQKAYQHKTNKIIEFMITEALLKADPILEISKKVVDMEASDVDANMEAYSKLTDDIIEEILYSSGDDLKEAREILEKVVSRKLYVYLGKTKMTEMLKANEEPHERWKDELVKLNTFQDEQKLTKQDFEIIISAFDFGMKDKNPIENLHFYSKFDSTKAFKIPSKQVYQFLLPPNFSEKWINVYCTNEDKTVQKIAKLHFYQWCSEKHFLPPPNPPQLKTAIPQPKVFNDPIHGHMEFDPRLVRFIDTPQFQRLRFIKQLGGAYFVYPGASHNRFEHSLGVAHLAGQLVRSLQKKQLEEPEVEQTIDETIDEKDILCVEIAGLCHDLGHGPFSEVCDEILLQKVNCARSTVSASVFKQIASEMNLKDLTEKDVIFIEEMIKGIDVTKDQPKGRERNKYFLYDIVNNQRNGIDVNVFDSVARDCYQLGLKTNFDHKRFIKFAKVHEDKSQICIRDKVVNNMYDLFHTIAALYSKAYLHKVTMKINLMMSDVVKNQMKEQRAETEQQPFEIYSLLTDRLFEERSTEKLVARNIMERIYSRRLYKYSELVDVSQETKESSTISELVQEIASELGVKREDIGICVSAILPQNRSTEIIHGMKFYDKSGNYITGKEIDEKRPQISKPEITCKQWIHVFYKNKAHLDLTTKKKLMPKIRKPEMFYPSCVKFIKCSFS